MATVIKEFIYSGTLQIADIPIGATALTLHIWGGGGGSGGEDATGPGADGAAGHFVSKTDLDITAYDGVKSICVAVGGGGQGGTSGQEAEGGKNGQSLTGYSGGVGGSSGTVGASGSGGGGGGATTVTLFESGQSVNNIELAIAGGGAGSGGGGTYSRGGAGINTNSATGNSPDSLGENGAGHTGDGGGGGAGGGGADGGKGGSGAYGDAGGNSGYSGSNLVPSSGSEDNGSGKVPGGTGNAYYSSGIASGGSTSGAGGNGKAVLIFNIPAEGKYKVSGAWKNMTAIYTKVSGTWKRLLGGYTKVSGTWKAIWTVDILFQSNAAGFGNSDGGVTSGIAGTGGVPTVTTIPATAPNIPGDSGGSNICPHPKRKITNPHMATGYAGGNFSNAGRDDGWFLAGTLITMEDGSTKPIEEIKLKDKVAIGGFVFATGKFVINNLYDYNGIKVAGSHMVKENNKWVRVRDSEIGIAIGPSDIEAGIWHNNINLKFKVNELITLSQKYPTKQIESNIFSKQIAENQEDFTIGFRDKKTRSQQRIEEADLKYPIIVVDFGDHLMIADGSHRTQKAIDMKLKIINAKIIPVQDMKQFQVESLNDMSDGTYVVYIFGCENRRILINRTLFTDYFEVNEQTGLQKLGEKYFNEYIEHSDALDKEVVDFINKK